MKKTQNGFIGIAIVVIVALLIGVGGTYVVMNNDAEVEPSADFSKTESTTSDRNDDVSQALSNSETNVQVKAVKNTEDNTQINTKVSAQNSAAQIAGLSPYTLTESEILNATYKLSANFDGTKTVPLNVIFPQSHDKSRVLSGTVSISQKGLLENPSVRAPSGETFWIYKYEYSDSSRTEARVYIAGNFGASGNDDRAFIVSKINGVVTTKETTCVKASNGSCIIDANNQMSSISLVNTTDWKTYDSGRGFKFRYPSNFSFDNGNSTGEKVVFIYGGSRYFILDITNPAVSLQQDVQNAVLKAKTDSAQAATPVTVTSKPYTIGSVGGYLIISQGGDVLKNTTEIFKTQKGNTIYSFSYSYSAVNISTDSFYKQIQTIISTLTN